MGAGGEAALLESPSPTPAIPERVGIAPLGAWVIGSGKVAFPEGLDPLPPMTPSAARLLSLLIFTLLEPLINKASSLESAPTTCVSSRAGPRPTDEAAPPSRDIVVEGRRAEDDEVGRAGPYPRAEFGGVPGGVPI